MQAGLGGFARGKKIRLFHNAVNFFGGFALRRFLFGAVSGEEQFGGFGTPFVPGVSGLLPDPSPTPATRAGSLNPPSQVGTLSLSLFLFLSVE